MRTHQQPRSFRAKQLYGHFLGTVQGLTPTPLRLRVLHSLGSDPSRVLLPNPASNTDDSGTLELERIVQGWLHRPIPPHRRQPQLTIPGTIADIESRVDGK